jgi:hypothetical protein
MNLNAITAVLSQSLHIIPLLLVTVGCILLLGRTRSGVAITLLIGNLLTLAVSTAFAVFNFLMMNDAVTHEVFARFAIGLQVLSFIGGILFGAGFLMMALHAQRPTNSVPQATT